MPFFVYIIYSSSLNRFYTGTTDDVSRRILEHNSSKYPNSFTSKGIPWEPFFGNRVQIERTGLQGREIH
jgi:putative endonuclease